MLHETDAAKAAAIGWPAELYDGEQVAAWIEETWG